ncbi:fungal-specific transcription factor domain-containing protein [Spinellus fusiger]|nr:fungal-specific transcription factor domain-containing protein [Spinellus fusiger]
MYVIPALLARIMMMIVHFIIHPRKEDLPKALEARLQFIEKKLQTVNPPENVDINVNTQKMEEPMELPVNYMMDTTYFPISSSSYSSEVQPPQPQPQPQLSLKRTASVSVPNTAPTVISMKNDNIQYPENSFGYYVLGDMLIHPTPFQKNETVVSQPNEKEPYICHPSYNPMSLERIDEYSDDFLMRYHATEYDEMSQLSSCDIEYTDTVAPHIVTEVLVDKYFSVNHPLLAIIDKNTFMNSFQRRTSPPSQLLLYAICVYTCFSTSQCDPIWKTLGIDYEQSCKLFLTAFNDLVRTEYLIPRLSTLQALILICNIPSFVSDVHPLWIRTGMAVRMAQELGFYRAFYGLSLPTHTIELQKRIWYNVYASDRWSCAIMNRPLAISDNDCDIDLPMSQNYDVFPYFIRLSTLLGEVLRCIHSPKARSLPCSSTLQTIHVLQQMLIDWWSQLPEYYRITPESPPALIKEAGPLALCYYLVVILLYRNGMCDEEDIPEEARQEAVKKCREAAKQSVDIACLIPPKELMLFGWNYCVFSILQACLVHVYNGFHSDPIIAKEACVYSEKLIEGCLRPLSKHIPYAAYKIKFIQSLMKMTQEQLKISSLRLTNHQPVSDGSSVRDASTMPWTAWESDYILR